MSVPVEEKPQVFDQLDPTVSGTPSPTIIVDGSLSAGSKHIIAASGATDAATEGVKHTWPAGTKRITFSNCVGSTSHRSIARITFQPIDDVAGWSRLTAGYPYVRRIGPDAEVTFDTTALSGAAFTTYTVAVPVNGATLSSTKGTYILEGN